MPCRHRSRPSTDSDVDPPRSTSGGHRHQRSSSRGRRRRDTQLSSDTDSTTGPVTKKPLKKKYVRLPVSAMVLRPPTGKQNTRRLRRRYELLAGDLASSTRCGTRTAPSSRRDLKQVPQIPLHFQKCTYFLFYHHTQTHTIANRDQAYINSFRNLLTFSPVVKTKLATEGSDKEKIGTLLDTARSSTRRSNASSIKDAIGNWHDFSPGLSKKKDSTRGWDHDECARLLCPPTITWNDT